MMEYTVMDWMLAGGAATVGVYVAYHVLDGMVWPVVKSLYNLALTTAKMK